jgi:hypothetical protein
MRRRLTSVVFAAVWLLSFFWPLLSPGRALANRDVPLFHLPLRAAFRHLAGSGLPVWNPWLHGGQPILSNPSYAAFYPPSWLVLVFSPAYALSLLVVLHAALAFGGAWFLARRLGAGRGAAALAALGYTGSGALLSLLSAFTLFCSMAWLPWVLAWGDAMLERREERRGGWLRPALLCGGCLALQLLNGEPVTVVVSGLGLLALGLERALHRPLRPALVLRTAVPVLVAVALSAVQLLPTWQRLADSPRAGGLDSAQATTWSAPPARLVELVFPRFFGDPARPRAGFFFGWNLHDRDFPYVASLYPGLLLAVLGVCALALWPIPRRGAWALGVLTGAFLALGRHNPLFESLREAVPVLGVLRYPEKFAILAVVCLGIAGVLGWQRLMDERAAGRHSAADFPLALAGVLLATALSLAGILYASPRTGLWFIRTHGGPDLTEATALGGLEYLRGEAWMAVAMAAAVTALLAACRARRPSGRALTAAALALLGADLWHYGHGFVTTLPASEYSQPPALAAAVAPESRLFIEAAADGRPDLVARAGDPVLAPVRALLARMEPYSGSLWGVPYAMHEDYDLMLTHWGRRSLLVLHREWEMPSGQPGVRDLAWRFLGAWNVGTLFLRKDPAQHAAEIVADPRAVGVQPIVNPYLLPRYRFVPRVSYHSSWGSALYVSRRQGYAVARHEHCVRDGVPPAEAVFPVPPQPLELRDTGGRVEVRYRASTPAFFVLAATWDRGWQATVDGEPRPAWPTGLGQIGVELPAGEHRLVLAYRERLLPAGAAVTGLALLAWGAALAVPARRRRSAGVAGVES